MNFLLNKKNILLVILLIGTGLRLWGLSFGLPGLYHQDEPIIVNHAMAYGTGDLNPHFFAIPPLTSYFLFFIYGVLFVVGKLAGFWSGSQGFAVQFFKDPSIFYLLGRFFCGVIPGILSILSTYIFSRKFLSQKASLFASAVMSVSFLNVINSHYIYTDMFLVLFMILSYDRIFELYRSSSVKNYCIAGMLVGLSIGTKYNGIILVFPYCLAHFMASMPERKPFFKKFFDSRLLSGGIVAIISFFIVNPFFVLDFPGFYRSFSVQSGAFWYTGGTHHLLYSLVGGMSPVLVILGGVGLLALLFRGGRGMILFIFPAIYYFVLVFKSQHFARYVLPLVPFFAVGCGYFFMEFMFNRLKVLSLKRLLMVMALVSLLPTFVKSVKADILFSSVDTRTSAAKWIQENVPVGMKIACDSTNFRPTIKQPVSQLTQKKEYLDMQNGLKDQKAKKLDLMIMVSEKGEGYPIYFISRNPEKQGQFLDTVPSVPYDIAALKRQGIRYVVLNGQLRSPEKDAFLVELNKRANVVMDFSPYKDDGFRFTGDRTATTCLPIMDKEVFSRDRQGPPLRLFKLK